MKSKDLAALILIVGFAAVILWSFAGCSTVTPDQVKAYSDATHSVIGNGLQDYKAVKRATKE